MHSSIEDCDSANKDSASHAVQMLWRADCDASSISNTSAIACGQSDGHGRSWDSAFDVARDRRCMDPHTAKCARIIQ